MLYPFVANSLQNFTFQPTLGGLLCTVTVTWNAFANRWYVNIVDVNGIPIITTALVSSADPAALLDASWDEGVVTLALGGPHFIPLGSQALIRVSGCTPTGYNVVAIASVVDAQTLSLEMADNPGQITQLGVWGPVIDLSSGLLPPSALYYYEQSGNFESVP